jgi:ABC-type antimicrobial peptide transport system permease subunit
LVSYQVTRRTREIGIRMALGAERLQVMNIFLKHAALMSIAGIVIGLAVGSVAHHVGEPAFGGTALHPALVAIVSATMFLTTIAASLIPARRAANIDPQRALREE